MRKLVIGLLFGSVTFLANAADWATVGDLSDVKVDMDRSSYSQYRGQIIGGGSPSNYATAFVRFSYKPGAEEYKKGIGSTTYEYLTDCSSNTSVSKSVLYRGINGDVIRMTTFIEVLNQNDFNTPYPNTVNQNVTALICYFHSKVNEKR